MSRPGRHGNTLIELLVVISITALLIGLILSAIQKVRASAMKLSCSNNLRQCTLACHLFHDTNLRFPPGVTSDPATKYMSYLCQLLPYLERENLYTQARQEYLKTPFFTRHNTLAVPLSVFGCPADPRSSSSVTYNKLKVGLTSYLGVNGTDYTQNDGIIYLDSRVSISHITDGTSSTLILGERPASNNNRFGWWYAGIGQRGTGSVDLHLGVRERNASDLHQGDSFCPRGPYSYHAGSLQQTCDAFHFWSLHDSGSHFSFADGSVKFLNYNVNRILSALATRAGQEVATLD